MTRQKSRNDEELLQYQETLLQQENTLVQSSSNEQLKKVEDTISAIKNILPEEKTIIELVEVEEEENKSMGPSLVKYRNQGEDVDQYANINYSQLMNQKVTDSHKLRKSYPEKSPSTQAKNNLPKANIKTNPSLIKI